MEDFRIDTKKISRPPSAPASPRFDGKADGLDDPDDLTDALGQSALDGHDDDDDHAHGSSAHAKTGTA